MKKDEKNTLSPDGYDKAGRISTLNNMGWEHPANDEITAKFLNHCQKHHGTNVLEIGAAYGSVSEKAVNFGANVWINDLDSRHLEIFKQKIKDESQLKRITLVPGDFSSDEIHFFENSFDAVLAIRVFLFFDPEKLIKAIEKIFKLLKKSGRFYVVADSPYLSNWKKFIPVYESRKVNGDSFPGYIINASDYNNNEIFKNIPAKLHFMDIDVLSRVFSDAGFRIIESKFLNRLDYPDSMRLDGRESVGFIVEKQ